MPIYSATVGYNGAPFHGFAKQPGQLTVQGSIEEALEMVLRRPVETVCAGRTDAGVHARGQVVSFHMDDADLNGRSLQSFQRSLNALTHESITLRDIRQQDDEFSARFSAQWREYRYFIAVGEVPPLFMRDFCWHVPAPLSLADMRQAAKHLIGEHDFKSFCMAASAIDKPTCRNVMRIDIEPDCIMGEDVICITVVGNAFLHSMVRTIVGTLVAVGLGQRTPAWVVDVLAACDRSAAGQNAPAQGLIFWEVGY